MVGAFTPQKLASAPREGWHFPQGGGAADWLLTIYPNVSGPSTVSCFEDIPASAWLLPPGGHLVASAQGFSTMALWMVGLGLSSSWGPPCLVEGLWQ